MWENRDDARSAGCNQGEMLHVAVVIQACIRVAVVIHTCLLLPPAMTLRDRKVRVSKTISGSGVGVRVIMVLAYVSLRSGTSHTHLCDRRLADKNAKTFARVHDGIKTKLKLPPRECLIMDRLMSS